MSISAGNAQMQLSQTVNVEATNSGLQPTVAQQSFQTAIPWSSIGTGPNQFKEQYTATRTLAASANETLDLYGALVDLLGNTVNFTKIVGISIELLTTTPASSITVGGASSHPWLGPLGGTTPTVNIANGGYWSCARPDSTGWTVTSGSAENLKVANNDSSNVATYRVNIIGYA